MERPKVTPLTLAIAGGSGSGKTTLARAVARILGDRCAVLDHDSYYRCLGHLPPDQRALVNFDHPDSLENELLVKQLLQLREGQQVVKPKYDFSTHTRMAHGDLVAPRPVILVEGILVLALPQLQRSFDLRVFVDAPKDLRFRRRSQRDVRDRGRTEESVKAQWQATVQPMHERFVEPSRTSCDLVVSGTEDVATAARRIAAALDACSRHGSRAEGAVTDTVAQAEPGS